MHVFVFRVLIFSQLRQDLVATCNLANSPFISQRKPTASLKTNDTLNLPDSASFHQQCFIMKSPTSSRTDCNTIDSDDAGAAAEMQRRRRERRRATATLMSIRPNRRPPFSPPTRTQVHRSRRPMPTRRPLRNSSATRLSYSSFASCADRATFA